MDRDRLEESHKAEDKTREAAYRHLENDYEKLKQEYEVANALVSSHETKTGELQAKIDLYGEDFNLQMQAHDSALLKQQEAASSREKTLNDQLLALRAEYEATRVSSWDGMICSITD